MSATHGEQIIQGYLARLEVAMGAASPGARADLSAEVTSHITEARAGLTDETDADVLNILDRLGEPAALAAELADRQAASSTAALPAGSAGHNPGVAVVALLIVCIGPLVGASFYPIVGPMVLVVAGLLVARFSGLWRDRDLIAAGCLPVLIGGTARVVAEVAGHWYFETYFVVPAILGIPTAVFLALRARRGASASR